MLIVAMPKSASTSLMVTLGQTHSVEAIQEFHLPGNLPEGFDELAKLHTDMRELDREQVDRFTARDRIRKQHVLPTDNNLRLLGVCPKVVLLREPHEIVQSYRRGKKVGVVNDLPMFAGCETEQEWMARAQECGLLGQLKSFEQRWRDHEGPKLLIEYSELVADPKGTINRVEEFFDLPVSQNLKLAKMRYSRSLVRNVARQLWLKLRKSV